MGEEGGHALGVAVGYCALYCYTILLRNYAVMYYSDVTYCMYCFPPCYVLLSVFPPLISYNIHPHFPTPRRALKGTDAEARIRVKFSAAAATASWFGAATNAINLQAPKGSEGGGRGQCEVPVNPPLPLSGTACRRWARSMPRGAVAALEESQSPVSGRREVRGLTRGRCEVKGSAAIRGRSLAQYTRRFDNTVTAGQPRTLACS